MRPLNTLLISCLAAVTVVITSAFHLVTISWAPLVLIAAYATYLTINSKRNPQVIRSAADQVYFLGYLCTVAALTGMLLRIKILNAQFNNASDFALTAFIAFTTIIMGLISMTTMKAYAESLSELSPQSGLDALKQLANAVNDKQLPKVVSEAVEQVAAMKQTAVGTQDILKELRQELDLIKTSLNTFGASLDISNAKTKTFTGSVREMDQVLTDYVRIIQTQIDKQ